VITPYTSTPETGSGLVGAMIGQVVVGAGNTTLNFLDAFCVTQRCKEAKKQRAADLEIAKLQKEGIELQAAAAQYAAKQGVRTQQTIIILGFGTLALGAWYLAGRKR
jgi:hypothetical protein